ncbi:MAG: acyl carrier protein [Planctomycetales bacterium]|nr:acyl carrier protein [bacterium]UNM09652.1 MAG: acyl carrier protein [Planctomycetales bacterium]
MSSELREKIIQFIYDEYVDDGTEVDDNTPLISSGLVDSFSMVSLKMYLEQEFEIEIDDDEASTEEFETVSRIQSLVNRKLQERQ